MDEYRAVGVTKLTCVGGRKQAVAPVPGSTPTALVKSPVRLTSFQLRRL